MNGQQLKNSILQMAVQGKLVPQDPNDEPASVLIQRIREEKEKLIKERKIKKEKNPSYIFRGSDNLHYEKVGDGEPVCIAEQVPFVIPDSWEWVRLGNIITLISGQDMTPDMYNSQGKGIPYITGASNIENNNIIINRWTEFPKSIAHKGNLLLTCKGTVGTMAILNEESVHIARQIMAIVSPYDVDLNFIKLFLESHVTKLNIIAKSMIPGISRDDLTSILFPLPPINEQRLIVKKFNTILPCVNEYDLTESKIVKLNAGFPEQLKKSILQEAVQGKLVPQYPSDEPAGVLLERIREEKARQVKEGKIKKDKNEAVIFKRDNSYYEKLNGIERCIDEEIPFEIPDSWEWVRLGNVCKIARGGSPRPIKQYLTESPDGINWIKIGDTDKDSKYINSTKEKIIVEGVTKSRLVHKGDFLLTNSMSFGRPYILNIDGCIHDGWLMLSNYQTVYDKDFLYYMLSSRFAYYQFCGVVSGAVVKNLNTDKVEISLMPLPPFAEQQRIVAKIEQFLAMIKGL